jgi:outer membrane receptor protein involved in Fe transport
MVMPLHSATALLAAAFLLLSVPVRAQTADQLAKYDTNHNGKLDPDELAAMQADQAKAGAPVELNPFVVDTSQEKGYFAASTLAGTRLNTNIGDLPSSITVVTKQQMEDTNSLNINDVFRYEANTEGSRTYTPFTTVRSNITDSNGSGGGTTGNFTSALDTGNRIRGLAAADQNEDNFFSLYRIPFDAYNTQSIEIDRGPNSLIFGTGSPAGIVNQSRIPATLEKFSGETQLQVSSWGGYRESIGLNIPIKKDVLAVYVAQMFGSVGYEEKPSSDLTRRQYAAFTFVPFKSHKTKLTGSFENYNNYADTPNYITPIDAVTPWLQSGRPVYNQQTSQVTYLSTGVVTGAYAFSTTAPNYVPGGAIQANLTTSTSPFFVPAMQYFVAGHNIEFWNQGVLQNFYKGEQLAGSVPGAAFSPTYASLTPAQQIIYAQRPTYSNTLPVPSLANGTAKYTVWYLPGLVNKSIYDWSKININSLDVNDTRSKTYTLDLQQELFKGLNLDLSWFRQELKQTQDDPESQAAAPEIYVDTTSTLPTGAPNPYVGKPLIDAYSADVYNQPEINNNYRAMLEYEFDLREKVPSWLSWLGHHRVVGAYSQHDDVQTALRYREAITGGDPNYLPTTTAFNVATGYAYTSNTAIEQVFYLGAPTTANGNGTAAPGFLRRPGYGGPTSLPISTYNYVDNQWETSTLNFNSVLFSTGGISENLQDQKSYYWQSYFWNDRLVGTVGIDDDEVKNRSNIFPSTNPLTLEYTNGLPNTPYWYKEGPWSYVGGNTSSLGFVIHPFKNWSRIDAAANEGNHFAGFLRTVGFTFNKAGNFNPPPSVQTDFFGKVNGKPAGQEKDYGIELATPDNKFFLKATWFTNSNQNVPTTFTSVGRGNYIDGTLLKDWATTVVQIRSGQNPTTDPNFGNTQIYPITSDQQNQIAALTGLPYNYGGNVGEFGEYINPTGTESGSAKGIDLELNYNPTPNWTMKVTWGKQQTVVSGAAAQAAAWFAYRMPKWVAYAASDLPTVYTKTNGTQMFVGNFWQGYGYDANTAASNSAANNAAGLTTSQSYFNNIVNAPLIVDQANNGGLAPNQREYTWTYLTNYHFSEGSLRGFGVTGVLSYDGRANAGYYGNTNLLSPTGQIQVPDITNPIYTPAKMHVDLGVSYQFKLPHNVTAKLQLNVADVTSNGYLLPVSYNFDGSPAGERIVAPRQYSFTTKFNF